MSRRLPIILNVIIFMVLTSANPRNIGLIGYHLVQRSSCHKILDYSIPDFLVWMLLLLLASHYSDTDKQKQLQLYFREVTHTEKINFFPQNINVTKQLYSYL